MNQLRKSIKGKTTVREFPNDRPKVGSKLADWLDRNPRFKSQVNQSVGNRPRLIRKSTKLAQ